MFTSPGCFQAARDVKYMIEQLGIEPDPNAILELSLLRAQVLEASAAYLADSIET